MVLHAALPGHLDATRADALLEHLPYARRLELGRREASARHASLVALDLVLSGIARLRGGVVRPGQLRFPQDGKPHLEGGPSFSLSHTRTRVVVALGEGCEVGVDVEDASQPAGRRRTREQLERWTATEAALKAVGAGLRAAAQLQLAPDLASAEFAGVRIHLARLDLGPGWVARLATLGPAGSVTVEEVVAT